MNKFIVLIWICISFNTLAQPSIDNEKAHRRYWYYKTRFVNDFIKLGKNQGEGIDFSERNFNYSANNINTANVGPDQIDLTNM